MVVDCGGGTVDITVHELAGARGKLRESYRESEAPLCYVGKCRQYIIIVSSGDTRQANLL